MTSLIDNQALTLLAGADESLANIGRGALAGLVGIIAVLVGADRFVSGAATISRRLGVSSFVIGMVVIGLGTSAPELLVSVMAAMQGSSGIAVGNVLGSNVSNVAFVLGCTVLVAPVELHRRIFRREIPRLILATMIAGAALADLWLGRWDALLLLATLVAISARMFFRHRRGLDAEADDGAGDVISEEVDEALSTLAASFWLVAGLAFLVGGSRAVVWGGTALAVEFGVDDLFIGVTLVALGTSLPELASSVVAARKREHEMAIGNIIGSNLINLLMVLPVTALVHPIEVPKLGLERDFIAVVLTSFLLWLIVAVGRREDGTSRVGRRGGLVLCIAYLAYISVVTMGLASSS